MLFSLLAAVEATVRNETRASDGAVSGLIIASCLIGGLFAVYYTYVTAQIKIVGDGDGDQLLTSEDSGMNQSDVLQKVQEITDTIADGAKVFLFREYVYMAVFIVVFGIFLFVIVGSFYKDGHFTQAIFTTIAFVLGSITSIVSGYIGMRIAVFANGRTAVAAQRGYGPAFVTAFRAGCVMGFALVSLGVIVLYIVVQLFRSHWDGAIKVGGQRDTRNMYEAIAGYGLGGSSIALFGRVGGGIYTKAADVGADLVGKLEYDLNEDDPKNPACIADNVGDNVGDVAGMGADLFGSFAESSCAAMVIASQSTDLSSSFAALCFPMIIIGAGTLVCLLTSFIATNLMVVGGRDDVEPSLKRQLLVSTVLMTPTVYLCTHFFLPDTFSVSGKETVQSWKIFICVCCGLWSGLIIGYITEYYTSNAYSPVREVAESCETGAATNIIYGLALGYKSVIIPCFCLAATVYTAFWCADMYGIACAALGILSTLSIGLTIDSYGPICDNAGGIAEMSGMPEEVRERTDTLDAAGNTTAAIGKGFAIGSAALVSLALFGGYVTVLDEETEGSFKAKINILEPFVFAGLLCGAMLPYWFSAMCMKSVGMAALAMVKEVRRQFQENEDILLGNADPDYAQCVSISTDASLREMMKPGLLVMGTPLLTGFLFGTDALAGVLAGALVSGVQMAISASNTGGAWDNAKKYIESGMLGDDKGKGSEEHKAAIVGDTVGDPLKDTSGPSLNILIKLMAIISLVFARSFPHEALLPKLFAKFH